MSAELDTTIPETARRSVVVVLIAFAVVAVSSLFLVSLSYFKSVEIEEAESRLSLYARSLNETIERFQHLPSVLSRYPIVIAGAAATSNRRLNEQLASFSEEAGLEAIYLMDRTGLVLAASNFNAPQTFVGQNYGFRPYFKNALEGERGQFFGIGATTGRPGYFVSEAVRTPLGEVTGVIAIKLDMSELQKAWEEGGERVFVSNRDGVIVLSSNPEWLYQTLSELSANQQAAIAAGKQFGNEPLLAFDWEQASPTTVSVGDQEFIYASTRAKRLGWNVHYLLDNRRGYERAALTTIIFGGVLSVLLAFATFQRSVRIKAALRASQADRAQLLAANAEINLAQKELARRSKLAALGQLSASVTHELGQPISAMRNYLTAAELDGDRMSGKTLDKLSAVVSRMENITRQLRFFTKPGDEALEIVSLQDVLAGVMTLMEHDVEEAQVHLEQDIAARPVRVFGNRLRLEQVLVNLMRNALAALETIEAPVLSVSIREDAGRAILRISDNGIGFGGRELQQMQEPFHTTRASGDGMGLGLSITAEIVKEHSGFLTAHQNEKGGADFEVSIPLAEEIA